MKSAGSKLQHGKSFEQTPVGKISDFSTVEESNMIGGKSAKSITELDGAKTY
jgi:hypothetical protein